MEVVSAVGKDGGGEVGRRGCFGSCRVVAVSSTAGAVLQRGLLVLSSCRRFLWLPFSRLFFLDFEIVLWPV